VADRVGQTRKTLAGRFSTVVGLTPKRFARVRRFQRLLAAVGDGPDVDWARLAIECRYYDQAHLIRDFRAFTDGCPTAYRPRSATDRNHQPLPG
jgi:AraC-like DNA-binding protein